MLVAIAGDRLPVHVLHDDIGLTLAAAWRQPSPAVQKARDVGMIKRGEDLPLAPEALKLRRIALGEPQQLDCSDLLELAIVPRCAVNRAHSALADSCGQTVVTHPLSVQRSPGEARCSFTNSVCEPTGRWSGS